MRLSEVEGFNVNEFMLVKFTKSEWIQGFIDGNIYMNNFDHFIEQEKQSGHKGQGDSYEAAFVFEVRNVRVYDTKTNELILTSPLGSYIERYNYFKKTPLFCMTMFSANDFTVLEENEDYILIKLDIKEEEKKRFVEDFNADTVAITFRPYTFIQRFKARAAILNAGFVSGNVKYVDYSVMDSKRKKAFDEGDLDFLFAKHHSLSYQREYRFILSSIQSSEPYTFEIGNISDLFVTMSVNKFLNESYIQLNFKK
jgi:hypothetical protein